jgi:hypothetical protein
VKNNRMPGGRLKVYSVSFGNCAAEMEGTSAQCTVELLWHGIKVLSRAALAAAENEKRKENGE